jgi:hypothetical protein
MLEHSPLIGLTIDDSRFAAMGAGARVWPGHGFRFWRR